jgi:outer membrane murein-binding lipoprotein Lpp
MSEDKKTAEKDTTATDPLRAFRQMYEQTLKQSAEHWEEIARNPLFLATMANNFEQSLKMQAQMQELVAASLKTLNLPSKEDILFLAERINQLRSEIAEINAKIDALAKNENTTGKSSADKTEKKKSKRKN